jgi:beta-N-acetylhexosaminidase
LRGITKIRPARSLTRRSALAAHAFALISVDHEGGRVQRFRDGFTAIPPMRHWASDGIAMPPALAEAARLGSVIARELRAHGIDFSFTPVLDVDFGASAVIGDRAFSSDPNVVRGWRRAFARDCDRGGCSAVGKHFPGHGFVAADSHLEVPIDERPLSELMASDLVPFAALAKAGLEAVMPAHVVYPAVDDKPAGFSRIWIEDILRGRLQFDGPRVLGRSRHGRRLHRGRYRRARDAAIDAGCDMVLTATSSMRRMISCPAGNLGRSLGSKRGRRRWRGDSRSFATRRLGN